MTIDQIIKVDIAISEAMAIDGGYDTILIIGPLPKTPGGHMTPDVAGYRYAGSEECRLLDGRPGLYRRIQGLCPVAQSYHGDGGCSEDNFRIGGKGRCYS